MKGKSQMKYPVLLSILVSLLITCAGQAQSLCTTPPFPRYAFFQWAHNATDAAAGVASQGPTVMPPPSTWKAGTPPFAMVATGSPRVPYVYLYIAYAKCTSFAFYPPLPPDVFWHEFSEGDPWCELGDTLPICAAKVYHGNLTSGIYQRNGLFATPEGTFVVYWFND